MTGSSINTGSFPRLQMPGISILFGDFYAQLEPKHSKVYMKKSSQRHFEEAVQLVGVGQAERKDEGDAISLDASKQGYARRTYHQVWQKAMKITMEAIEDNQYRAHIPVMTKQLAESLFHAKEVNGAALFNNATSTNAPYVGADGVALLSASHPSGSGGTFSNLSTSDLSELALENALIAMKAWVGSNGLRMDAKVKSLLIPNASRYQAHRILRSDLRSGSADNDANALKDMNDVPNIIEWNFLTDTNSWFLLTNQDGLCYYERQAVKPRHYQEDTTFDQVYVMYERYSFDHYDPRCVYGSMGAS